MASLFLQTIIGNLDKEQAKFKDEVNANKLAACILPWADLPDQWVAKKHILSLSLVIFYITPYFRMNSFFEMTNFVL